MNVITCHQLTKTHGRKKALNGLNLSIEENTMTGLIGRNGAGKTTLLKIMAGFWKKTAGDVRVLDKDPFNNLFVSANIIYVDDQLGFPNTLRLKEILEQGKRFYRQWDMAFAQRLFDYFQFDPRDIHEHLSKGRKSTFNMIFGLASRSPITLFDEPTTGMDLATRKDIYRVLLRDYMAYPRTIIISSHHLNEIENILENVLLVDRGKDMLHRSIDELKTYARQVSGNTALVMQWAQDVNIIHQEHQYDDFAFVVVENNLSTAKWNQAKQLGLTLSGVTPSDLCLYLTEQKQGGIDHVLHYN
ncbi:MAG TPA: ABC transporter ATP-binding protein [Cerasibacillus sp.]|uniref:ABC transporter ATP-binding protein n=1 Tax=Cerasibacillus sp. TaxID=2498711 RepID=UPI002F4215EE